LGVQLSLNWGEKAVDESGNCTNIAGLVAGYFVGVDRLCPRVPYGQMGRGLLNGGGSVLPFSKYVRQKSKGVKRTKGRSGRNEGVGGGDKG